MNKYLITLLAGLFCVASHAENFQTHEEIYQAITKVVKNKMSQADYAIHIVPIDSRLELPKCTQALAIDITNETMKAGRNTLTVRCQGERHWTIYASVVLSFYKNVLILTQPLQRGERITPSVFTSERRDVSGLREDYFTLIEQVENKQASRALAAGTLLSLKNVSEPLLIKRGDRVDIRSTSSGLAITMSGIAVSDGIKGQRINVKNQSSGRIINATVIDVGVVSVN